MLVALGLRRITVISAPLAVTVLLVMTFLGLPRHRTEAMSALWWHVEELQGDVVGILGVQVQAAFILDDP
jgi:hypothetical protein